MIKEHIRKVAVVLGAVSLLPLAGCSLASAVAYQANGPSAIKAKYVLPQEPTLVLVENYSGGAVRENDTSTLVVDLIRELKDNKVVPLIDQDVFEKFKDSTPADTYSQMTITQIGKACGAKQVLYVHVLGATSTIPTGAQTISGEMQTRVKVIDVKTGLTRWPDTDEGDQEAITTPVIDNSAPGTELQVHQDMSNKMAVQIADLFHDWKPQFENQEKTQATGLADGPN